MRQAATWVTIPLLWILADAALAAPATKVDREVNELLSHFITAFENLDLPAFMDCFADDATAFFPVPEPPDLFVGKKEVHRQFRQVFAGIRASATSGPPYQHLSPENTQVKVLSPEAALVTFQLRNAERLGRRTLVLKKSQGHWLITQLHASNVPIEHAAGATKPLIVPPGSAPRYAGPQGRENDITELLATGVQTGKKLGMFLQTIAPGSGPPVHLHHGEVEFAYVVSGQFTFKAADEVAAVPVGSFIFIPPGTAHTFKNTASSPGRLLFGVIPGGFEQMFADRQGVDSETNKQLTEKYEHVLGPPLP